MEKTLMERIDRLHGARECSGAAGRLRCAAKLLVLYAAFGIHRAYLLLLTDPSKSFTELHRPDANGRWPVSYADHLRFRVRMRVYAFGTAISLLASFAMTVSIVQLNNGNTTTYALTIMEINDADGSLTFDENPTPDDGAQKNSAAPTNSEDDNSEVTQNSATPSFSAAFSATATNNISITTTTANVAGSLQTAVTTANASAANDVNNIRFTVAGTYTLPAALSVSRRTNFSNTSGGRVIVNGSGLGGGDACIDFDAGSASSTVTNVQFQDCPTAISISNTNGIEIGSDDGSTDVTIAGGGTGISIDSTAGSQTIQYVTVGQDDLGNDDALTGTGINVQTDDVLITNSTVGNAQDGIVVSGDDVIVRSSYIGITENDDDIGNTQDGINISGDRAIVGGSSESLGNVIGNNGRHGVATSGSASNTTIQNNAIGLTSADGDAGNTQRNVSIVAAGAAGATVQSNRIAFAGTDGLALVDGQSSVVRDNALFSNTDNGISISGGLSHQVNDNTVGVFTAKDDSTSAGGNGGSGIVISDGASEHVIGADNTISYNAEYGVEVKGSSSEFIAITQNDFSDNTLGAIGLSDGANGGISSPTLNSATSSFISGEDAQSGDSIEVYADGAYLGSTSKIASDGSWSIDIGSSTSLNATGANVVGADVNAIRIDSDGNTSVFSNTVVGSNAGDAFKVSSSVATTTTSATISITTGDKASTTLKYGTSSTNLDSSVTRSTRKKSRAIELTGLQPNTTYYYKIIAENASSETVRTNVLTFSTDSSDPLLTSLSGDFSVVTQPETLSFEGTVNGASKSHFRFVNPDTRETIAVCATDDTHVCTLPYTLAIGEYDVYFDSATNAGVTIESSDVHRLVVSPPVVTTLLTGDKRTDDYFTRVVLNDVVTLVGLQPANSDVAITLDGVGIDSDAIESAGDQSFRATLDLSALERGRDYLVEVTFTDSDSGAAVGDSLYYPIKFAHVVVEPQVSGIGSSYALGQAATATVVAGANDTLTVTDNGFGYLSTTLAQIDDTVQGQASFSLPTDTVGVHTITIQTTNSIGLSSAVQSYTYTVFGAAAGTGDDGTTDDGTTGDDTNDQNTGTDGEQTPGDNGDGGDPNSDITDPAQRALLKARLNNLLRSTLNIEARRLVLDGDGNVVEDSALERNVNGDVVLRSEQTVGLRPSTWFDFGSTNSVDVLQFSGVSEPFATVTLTIFSDPIIQVTEADDKGAWTMNVAVSDLPEGQHTAFLKSESRGVESDEVEIARFVVVQEQQLSNTSWILIGNIIIALIIVSIMITIRIQHYREEKRVKMVRAQRREMTPEDLITELRNKQERDDDDDDDLHNALSV